MPMVNEGGGPTAGTAVAEPKAAGGIPGTGNPEDSENDPRVVFSNVRPLSPAPPATRTPVLTF